MRTMSALYVTALHTELCCGISDEDNYTINRLRHELRLSKNSQIATDTVYPLLVSRPHLGKVFTRAPEISPQQSRLRSPVVRYCRSLDNHFIIRTHPPILHSMPLHFACHFTSDPSAYTCASEDAAR